MSGRAGLRASHWPSSISLWADCSFFVIVYPWRSGPYLIVPRVTEDIAMLFTSAEFILVFLPVTIVVFFALARLISPIVAASWLTIGSLGFYGWWNPQYVLLLVASIVVNYAFGTLISAINNRPLAKSVLTLAVMSNLALLAYYKYANFFVSSLDPVLGSAGQIAPIILPLGISFFTFTQIAFLVDTYRREAKQTNIIYYALFVTYFPHLIAGPILHHRPMISQFSSPEIYRPQQLNFEVGLTIFIIGMFKKVVLADHVAPLATGSFSLAEAGTTLTFAEAWMGSLAYTFQLYFDFSGYSDMAIGVSRMLGVQLPINFASPYKARSIIEFWRRWHITLSTFLRDYLYIPLGGSRRGNARRFANLFITMLLGGLWHGAGWTFIIWGALHGLFLVANHLWRHVTVRFGVKALRGAWQVVPWALTFTAVVFAWVYFRASSVTAANSIIGSMVTPGEIAIRQSIAEQPLWSWAFIATLAAISLFMPNTQKLLSRFQPGLGAPQPAGRSYEWQPSLRWALSVGGLGAILAISMLWSSTTVREFLYYQF